MGWAIIFIFIFWLSYIFATSNSSSASKSITRSPEKEKLNDENKTEYDPPNRARAVADSIAKLDASAVANTTQVDNISYFADFSEADSFVQSDSVKLGVEGTITSNAPIREHHFPITLDDNNSISSTSWLVEAIENLADLRKKASQRLQDNGSDRAALHRQLLRGTKILDSQEELDAYLHMYGPMHERKLTLAFESLHARENLGRLASESSFQIVDYACGQGLASMSFMEFLKKRNKNYQVHKAIFIEPSKLALDACVSRFTGNVVRVGKKFDELVERDIFTNESCIKFHLLSNILDMGHWTSPSLVDIS